jgi:hypothetical protein
MYAAFLQSFYIPGVGELKGFFPEGMFHPAAADFLQIHALFDVANIYFL